MPHHIWFESIPIKGAARRAKDKQRKANERGGTAEYRQAPKQSTYYRIRQHGFQKARIGFHETILYRLGDIAAIYGLHQNTVQAWYNKNILPPPFQTLSKSYRSWGWTNRPVYLHEQVLVICKVLDDIYAQGITQFRQSHSDHIAMMRDGNDMVMNRLSYKAAKQKPIKPIALLPKPETTLRKRPAPHLRPMLREMREALKHYQNAYAHA